MGPDNDYNPLPKAGMKGIASKSIKKRLTLSKKLQKNSANTGLYTDTSRGYWAELDSTQTETPAVNLYDFFLQCHIETGVDYFIMKDFNADPKTPYIVYKDQSKDVVYNEQRPLYVVVDAQHKKAWQSSGHNAVFLDDLRDKKEKIYVYHAGKDHIVYTNPFILFGVYNKNKPGYVKNKPHNLAFSQRHSIEEIHIAFVKHKNKEKLYHMSFENHRMNVTDRQDYEWKEFCPYTQKTSPYKAKICNIMTAIQGWKSMIGRQEDQNFMKKDYFIQIISKASLWNSSQKRPAGAFFEPFSRNYITNMPKNEVIEFDKNKNYNLVSMVYGHYKNKSQIMIKDTTTVSIHRVCIQYQ
jgi:hypothetical protein